MNIKPPMTLFLGEEIFGKIVTYSYETPWAEGNFRASEENHLRAMIEVCELLAEIGSWPDLVCAEDDNNRWQDAIDRRSITSADLDRYSDGLWMVETQDGTRHEIFSPVFDRKGFLTWRW